MRSAWRLVKWVYRASFMPPLATCRRPAPSRHLLPGQMSRACLDLSRKRGFRTDKMPRTRMEVVSALKGIEAPCHAWSSRSDYWPRVMTGHALSTGKDRGYEASGKGEGHPLLRPRASKLRPGSFVRDKQERWDVSLHFPAALAKRPK